MNGHSTPRRHWLLSAPVVVIVLILAGGVFVASTVREIRAALDALSLAPVVALDMRLGEGSGALTALPIVQASAKILREMATFDSAGVSER